MKLHIPALFLTASLALAACGGTSTSPGDASHSASAGSIEVPLAARSGSKVSGNATFTEVDGAVKVRVQVAGAPPGKVATHVHEKGDCSAPDAASAGGHFNPGGHPHGMPPSPERHLGDLGNIDIGPDGTGATEVVVMGANLREGDPNSFLGRAIIVHEKQDDGGQPTGNAGGRIGCGVITARQ
jgi:superoxide dismutase, Cu-Zn family